MSLKGSPGGARSQEADPWGAFVDRAPQPFSGLQEGALAGVRVAVKDMIAVAGLKWTAGVPLLANRRAERDAACVERLRAAGARIVGVTATDAAGFGMTTPAVTNPRAPGLIAGGSSGGSAAAVAAGLADVALGTDTGGSVRVPAACCGVFGLKPTYGSIPLTGVTGMSASFDHVGVMASNLDLIERVLDVIADAPPAAGAIPKRIGVDPQRLAIYRPVLRRAVEAALATLQDQGCEIVAISLPDPFEIAEAHGPIVCREALEVWGEHWPGERARFGKTAGDALAYAQQVSAPDVARARQQVEAFRRRSSSLFDAVDAVVTATLAVPVPRAGDRFAAMGGARLPLLHALLFETITDNVSGLPALAVPLAIADRGIPLSLQISTRGGRDRDALILAGRLLQSCDVRRRAD